MLNIELGINRKFVLGLPSDEPTKNIKLKLQTKPPRPNLQKQTFQTKPNLIKIQPKPTQNLKRKRKGKMCIFSYIYIFFLLELSGLGFV